MKALEAGKLGKALVILLNLETNISGSYDTTIGTKTNVGLGRTIKRLLNDPIFVQSIIDDKV